MSATQPALGPGRAARALAMLFLGSFVLGSGELLSALEDRPPFGEGDGLWTNGADQA